MCTYIRTYIQRGGHNLQIHIQAKNEMELQNKGIQKLVALNIN